MEKPHIVGWSRRKTHICHNKADMGHWISGPLAEKTTRPTPDLLIVEQVQRVRSVVHKVNALSRNIY